MESISKESIEELLSCWHQRSKELDASLSEIQTNDVATGNYVSPSALAEALLNARLTQQDRDIDDLEKLLTKKESY